MSFNVLCFSLLVTSHLRHGVPLFWEAEDECGLRFAYIVWCLIKCDIYLTKD
jgi:hypothetical protein